MKLPDKDSVLKLLEQFGVAMTKRDLITAFGIKGEPARIAFKKLLKDLEQDGLIIKDQGKSYKIADSLPPVCVVEITEIDIDGDLLATPAEWQEDLQGKPPRIEIMPDRKGHPSLTVGDRALVRVRKAGHNIFEAQLLKKVDAATARVVGFIKQVKGGYLLSPIDRRAKHDFDIPSTELNGAEPNQVVVAEIQPSRSALRKKVRVVEVIGEADDPKAISLMALFEAGLRPYFPEEVILETEDMVIPPLGNRTDLRDFPLVTIDGKDARDFDDAVFAEPDTDKNNEGGYHLIVAIADVAHYVTHGSKLDKEAYLRGNSTYFPDRVLPMLPEKLSNDLCSLRPHEPRATLAVHMWINADGKLLRHKFVRGLMMSRARLTYEQVQDAVNGNTDDTTAPLMNNVIKPLYEAWKILDAARVKRGALDLDIPERKIVVNDAGEMTGVAVRERLDSHKVIEEFMILANVAAAEALEAKQAPCMYRIHDRPTGEKLMSASTFLDAFGLTLPKSGVAGPAQLNSLLEKAKKMPMGFLISEIILRSQAQAVYDPENIGHFGLALQRYAHFTSPIRRYADLMVHRSLIRSYKLGDGELTDHETVKMSEIAEHISSTERTSAEAERNSVDRFTAAYLKDKIGVEFEGRISGVTRFGLFIKLTATGADGLVPIRSLPSDYYIHDEAHHALVGRRTGRIFRLGAPVLVRIVEADPLTGSTVFELVGADAGAEVDGYKSSGKPSAPRRHFEKRSSGPKSKGKHPSKKSGKKDDKKSGEKRDQKPKEQGKSGKSPSKSGFKGPKRDRD
ncbi:MAG TPA: ribonuclease R [Alphaproteobacteria bacterium]|nr:ribonuclease R [Alphaproteobacteria bacterium]HNS43691.1 ribonuclease R [Alphaproteobacteria bacterium]